MHAQQYILDKKRAEHIGSYINNIRVDEGVPQEELSKKVKIDQSNISAMENNRKRPGLKTLMKILDALGWQIILQKKPQ